MAKIKVLVVDDEQEILELICDEFLDAGFDVFRASGGNEAFDTILREGDIDIVVSDVKMPNGDGISLLDQINGMDSSKKPVVYMISGHVAEEDVSSRGAKKFFQKPVNLRDVVLEIIDNISEL